MMILLGLLAWILPAFGIPLLACGAYLGLWAPLPAFGFAVLAWMLTGKNGKSVLGRFSRGLLAVPLLFLLGLIFSVLYFGMTPAWVRAALATLVVIVGGLWIVLSLRRPSLLKKMGGSPVQKASPLFLLSLFVVAFLPFFAWSVDAESSDTFLARELKKTSLEPLSDFHQLSSRPRGFAALMRSSRYLFRASQAGAEADIYVARLRHNREGVPVGLDGVYNLTETAAINESDLQVEGAWAAWRVDAGEALQQLEVVNMAGEAPGTGRGWDLIGGFQRAITNLQETGQFSGVGRTSVHLGEPDPRGKYHLKRGKLMITAHSKNTEWPLGGVIAKTTEEPEVRIENVPAARSGNLTTWAVDRVRAIPWIGSNGLQWIKAIVFRITSQAEDLRQDLVPDDPQAAVDEELGDVWARLPVVQESEISDWPPQAITPKLKEALPGEGVWIDMSYEPAFSGLKSGAMLFSFIRVDPKRPHNQVSIALWDPRRIELHVVAGTEEPRSTLGQRGTGLISRDPEVMTRLVGAFNGAFQAVHGEFGMMEDRVVQLPPKPFAATISTHEDGTTRLGTWPEFPTPIPPDMVGLRQNMTALVAEGKPNPYKRHWWGGVPEGWTDDTRTVRSAICRTKEGFLAYFYSPGITPEQLIDALMMTRCDYGIHLDMNGGHAGFELYRVALTDELPAVSRPLDGMWEARGSVAGLPGYDYNSRLLVRKMPLMNFPRYIQTTPRDFFYLTERALLPGPAPLKDSASSQEAWKPLALADNGYPHAVMTTRWSDPADKPIRILRFDPKQLVISKGKAMVGFGVKEQPTGGETSPPPAFAKTSRSLYFTSRKFILSTTPPPSGTLLVQTHDEGRLALCVDQNGRLTVFGPFLQAIKELPFEANCADIAWLPGIDSVIIGDEAAESPIVLSRAPIHRAEQLFPKTPIVPPAQWAIPQSKRANLVAN
jgi:hypothetical protein